MKQYFPPELMIFEYQSNIISSSINVDYGRSTNMQLSAVRDDDDEWFDE